MNDAKSTVEPIIREIAEPWRARLVEDFNAHFKGVVARYQADCAANPAACGDPHYLYPTNGRMGKLEYRAAEAKRARIHSLRVLNRTARPTADWINTNGPQNAYGLNPDWGNIVAIRADKDATEAVAGFVYKITAKLTGIVDAAGGLVKHSTFGSLRNNRLRLECANGLTCDVTNDVVWVCNEYGTVFCRYPTTFHSVILPGGERLKTPSEAKLKKALGVVDAAKELPADVCPGSGQPFDPQDGKAAYRYRPCPVCGTSISNWSNGRHTTAVRRHKKPTR